MRKLWFILKVVGWVLLFKYLPWEAAVGVSLIVIGMTGSYFDNFQLKDA